MSSVDLGSFLQRVEVGGSPLDPTCLAYRMDDNEPQSNMRTTAGLGTCNCCDYFTFRDATLVLIEETRLPWQIKDLRNEFAQEIHKDVEELGERERHSVGRRVLRHLRQENKLKVYGSLLVLCRLATVVDDSAEANALSRPTSFWLVYSDSASADDLIFFDSLRGQLYHDLRSALTGAVVSEVEILPAQSLATRLPPTPMVA